jgi:hypothetical protein
MTFLLDDPPPGSSVKRGQRENGERRKATETEGRLGDEET